MTARNRAFPLPYRNVAEVLEARDGHASLLAVEGERLTVVDHAERVPPLAVGDRVLFERLPRGAVVLERLRGDRPAPAPIPATVDEDGCLCIEHATGLRLRVGEARLELRADGTVLLDGEVIRSTARGLNRLQGTPIELN